MSEAIGRRLILQGGLAALAGAALYGCGSSPVAEPQVLVAPPPRHAALTAALKDALYAQYDVFLLKNKDLLSRIPALEMNKERIAQYWRDAEARVAAGVPEQRRRVLEERLQEENLPASIGADIMGFKDCDALEAYYANEGLHFHSETAFTMPGYELLRLSAPKQQTVMLLGKERAVTVQNIDEVLIQHTSTYTAMQGIPASVLAGQYWTQTKSIVMRPDILQKMTDIIFQLYETEMAPKGDALLDPKQLEPHLYSTPLPKEFWTTLGQQLRYQAMQSSAGEKKEALREAFARNIFLHEAMHAADDDDFGFITESKYAQDLHSIRRSNAELRAYLASMIDGHSRHALADTLRAGVFGVSKDAHTVAAQMFMDKMVQHIVANRKKYPDIDLSRNLASDVLRQLPKLSDSQIKQMATGIFEAAYRGRSLREYVQDFTK